MFSIHKPTWQHLNPTQPSTSSTTRESAAYTGWGIWLYQGGCIFQARWLNQALPGRSADLSRNEGLTGYWKGPHGIQFQPTPCRWTRSFSDPRYLEGLKPDPNSAGQLTADRLTEASLAIQSGQLKNVAIVLGDPVFAQARYDEQSRTWIDFTGTLVSNQGGWIVQLPAEIVPEEAQLNGPENALWQ